ncbi:agmatinase [Aneurinibacillus sp. Ricciae_BoGa-3]|uniref:agmatinase n=1 Tax=Aneurinibacillus sp. Ricciae_BoGa-3 TaxID=3022697 RepID=UPI0023414720|nr:agmatinase [Aneurinibacillus sp. Ricciae_BoGa-3]WCK56908.1 agmatinase [Aneurinibacillus sp. Ricciae_BoGa-3]
MHFFNPSYSGHAFFEAQSSYEDAQAVIYGMPMDWTTSFRPGSRFGPTRIREVSINLEDYSPYADRELQEVNYFDAGDIPLPFGSAQRSLEAIEEYVRRIVADGKFPIGLGGEHLVSLAPIKVMAEKYPDLVVVHIDAHTDLRHEMEGEELSHSAIIRRALDYVKPENVYQFGIRSGLKEEFEYARDHLHLHKFEVIEPLKKCLDELKGRPVYVTFDIDAVDPAFAPGTGTAEPGGITSAEAIESIYLLSALNVVGFDLVEVAPVLDQSERTQILASKLIREVILTMVK